MAKFSYTLYCCHFPLLVLATALAAPSLNPLPPPLPVPTLVELLKYPLCVGPARRLVLDQLQRHYGRSFADQWDFVRFAQAQHPELDLTSPPTRPQEWPVGTPK